MRSLSDPVRIAVFLAVLLPGTGPDVSRAAPSRNIGLFAGDSDAYTCDHALKPLKLPGV